MEETIKRIEHFEKIYDEAQSSIEILLNALENYKKMEAKISELKEYYESDLFMRDFEADEEDLLPKNLKRGILSEDCIYDLLEKDDEIREILK